MAQFPAAAPIVVYAGAVMVLYVFVAASRRRHRESPNGTPRRSSRIVGPILSGGPFIAASIAILGSGFRARHPGPDDVPSGFGTPEAVGHPMMEDFLIAFEAASLLLLVAAVAAIVLAGRRREDRPSFEAQVHGRPGRERERRDRRGSGRRQSEEA